jgi:hypothetical protein
MGVVHRVKKDSRRVSAVSEDNVDIGSLQSLE